MAFRKYRIPERAEEFAPLDRPGYRRRLGRNVRHDPRSLQYLVVADGTVASAEWTREIPILDQGSLGSCTGNAGTGALGSQVLFPTLEESVQQSLNEKYAVALYSDATKVDDDPDNYPPNDTGSDGLSIAKVLKARGLISGYTHITSVPAAQTAIQTGPFITGVNWYSGFDNPDSQGRVKVTGFVRGGHEFEIVGYDAATDLWKAANSWGTSFGVDGYFFFDSKAFARLLSEQGDATVFVPANQPAPTPTPTNGWPSSIVDPWLAQRHTGQTAKVAAAIAAYEKTLVQ